ncbi:MAG: tyrosine-type recombinase/integrase [Candidatus Bathyarchaeia archaeon]|jgi:integrase
MLREKFDDEVEKYLVLKGKATGQVYASAYTKFLIFYRAKYGKDASFPHFFKRVYDDLKKPISEQEDLVDIELTDFINWLKQQKTQKGEELSANLIRLYFAAIQNLLKWKHIPVSSCFIKIPAANGKDGNGKHKWKIEQIKAFVDAASSYREKAIILCAFQSGLGVNELCELNYGDVQDQLEAGILPICLELVRQKTQVHFKTFFGHDAVKYLKLYLETRGKLLPGDPLFAKERERGDGPRLSPEIIEQSFSEIAKKLDFIKLKDDAYNPARPHSLRAAFNSRLISKIPEDLRNFWMGHCVGGVARAYLNMPDDDMCQMYMSAEESLKIEKTSREVQTEIATAKSGVSPALEAGVKALETEVKSFNEKIAEVKYLKAKVESLETLYNKLFEVSPEELRELMQEVSRRKFAQQKEQEKQSMPVVTSSQEELHELRQKVSRIEQQEKDKKSAE